MNVSQAIENRRSIQNFDPNIKITDAEVRQLIEAAALTPSAFNIQHWRFLHVKDSAIREQLRKTAWYQSQVTDASAVLIVAMDVKAWSKSPERYCSGADEKARSGILGAIKGYYSDNEQAQRDDAFRSGSMAAMTIMLKAQEMGYDSCPMAFNFQAAAEIINLPDDYVLCMMIAIGKPLGDADPRPERLTVDELLFEDCF